MVWPYTGYLLVKRNQVILHVLEWDALQDSYLKRVRGRMVLILHHYQYKQEGASLLSFPPLLPWLGMHRLSLEGQMRNWLYVTTGRRTNFLLYICYSSFSLWIKTKQKQNCRLPPTKNKKGRVWILKTSNFENFQKQWIF